jgi:hypothetical protein
MRSRQHDLSLPSAKWSADPDPSFQAADKKKIAIGSQLVVLSELDAYNHVVQG